jgi:Alginate export
MAASRSLRAVVAGAVCGLAACLHGAVAQAQGTEPPGIDPPGATTPALPSSGAAGETTFLVENMTRAEVWRYFQPPPNAATRPEYTFVGNRSTLGVSYRGSRWSAQGALQYVRVENLPAGSIGPGLLGTGAAYYFQASGTFSYQFYLRRLSLGWRHAGSGAWVEGGRLSREASTETPSGDVTIDRLVGTDLNGRLLGDMEWSFYQRAWDGVRGGVRRGGLAATVTAAFPTQGTFEESANLTMDRVRVAAAELTLAPGTLVGRTRVELFAIGYDDTRPVTARPDNSGHEPRRVDIRVWTAGASVAGAYPSRWGVSDVVGWAAGQSGAWYELSHRAMAATGAAGHRFTRLPWRPWLRVGTAYASGDSSATDGRHGTFFPLLPSSDRVSRLNAYALMNVVDRWAGLEIQPHRALDVMASVRRVSLASTADRWYQGSGATLRLGNYFGFQGRNGRGGSSIGTVADGMVTWRPARWWTIRGFAGRIHGGDVVTRLFRDDRLVTAWLESTLHF